MEVTNPIGKINIRILIVDFFGSLMPGILFTGISILLVLTVFYSSIETINLIFQHNSSSEISINTFVNFFYTIIDNFHFELSIFLLVFSYVLGYIFYRQELRIPDQASFNRIKKKQKIEEWVAQNVEEVEYPYDHIYRYLDSRGLLHLSKMVPWSIKNGENIKRTKYFINILKIRLLYFNPDKCTDIIRNEAHIRLSSTTWYLLYKIKTICWVSLGFPFITLILSIIRNQIICFPKNLEYIMPIFIIFTIYLLIVRSICTIEKFFHYQRLREIIFVLETAYNLFRERIDIFSDIYPEYSKIIKLIKNNA